MRLELPIESRQTKQTVLSERISEAKNNSRSGIYPNIIGTTVISAGIVLSLFTGSEYAVFCALTGITFTIIGLYFAAKYGKKYSRLMEEFEEMQIQTPRCSSCGEELPPGEFWACPFCGKSLEPENTIDQMQSVTENFKSSTLLDSSS